ncbi:heterokaryon incompatibility protein-domain-containing protein [Immersiella caudata]|uniref:Heterokaryon incompatibility protein-domain-containing protein n=1 Tax=Immersiella caudata TaxID=314043 RepID=A0AA39X5V7_9PEZI|nr:heterokaryon incompatibility protein-domain-containing protein [Immersiella caudata]
MAALHEELEQRHNDDDKEPAQTRVLAWLSSLHCHSCHSLSDETDRNDVHDNIVHNLQLPVRRDLPKALWRRLSEDKAVTGCATCSLLISIAMRFLPHSQAAKLQAVDYAIYEDKSHDRPLELIVHYEQDGRKRKKELTCFRPPTPAFPWPIIGPYDNIDRNTGSVETLRLAKSWIFNCISSHVKCEDNFTSQLPKRVVQISGTSQSPRTKLYETRGASGRYACLSHCWGMIQPFRTLSGNIDAMRQQVCWSDLCQTFQDAIMVCLALEIEFIWIDSLCIIQDSEEDWREQAAAMASIYANGFLTIAATKSKDGRGGLFTATSSRLNTFTIPNPTPTGPAQYQIHAWPRITHFSHTPQDWWSDDFPLLSRGWVYQERQLSQRMLHFGPSEILWECGEQVTCECRAIEKSFNLPGYIAGGKHKWRMTPLRTAEPWQLQQRWYDIVAEFTGLQLSRPPDRLPALAGLAGDMQRHRRSRYLAGLWEDTIIFDLAWAGHGERANPWYAPTWSWASLQGGRMSHVMIAYKGTTHQKEAQLVCIDIKPDVPDATGLLQYGVITLRGLIAGFPLLHEPTSGRDTDRFYIEDTDGTGITIDHDYNYKKTNQGYAIPNRETIYFFRLATTFWNDSESDEARVERHYIILRSVSNMEQSYYERIGYLGPGAKVVQRFETEMFDRVAEMAVIKLR